VALAKARGRLDYADMRKAAPLDTESARAYATRALSAELDSYLCEPIVRTMLIADTDKVSKVELFSGIGNIFTAKILAAVGGQGRMPERLADGLKVHLQTPVTEVRRAENRVRVSYSGTTSDYDASVVTCPLPEAAAICVDDRSILGPLEKSLGYTQCISVAVGTTRPPDCPAFLVMFPSVEDPDIALMFLDHNKAPDRAPAGHGLLSCLWETGASERMIDAPDDAVVEHTLAAGVAVHAHRRLPGNRAPQRGAGSGFAGAVRGGLHVGGWAEHRGGIWKSGRAQFDWRPSDLRRRAPMGASVGGEPNSGGQITLAQITYPPT
jgi:oxygen-dependent protoporphyrinogen oxidase